MVKEGAMKVKPYYIRFSDSWILGPCASRDLRECRIAFAFILFEVGLMFEWEIEERSEKENDQANEK